MLPPRSGIRTGADTPALTGRAYVTGSYSSLGLMTWTLVMMKANGDTRLRLEAQASRNTTSMMRDCPLMRLERSGYVTLLRGGLTLSPHSLLMDLR